jgi:hypothetical protein
MSLALEYYIHDWDDNKLMPYIKAIDGKQKERDRKKYGSETLAVHPNLTVTASRNSQKVLFDIHPIEFFGIAGFSGPLWDIVSDIYYTYDHIIWKCTSQEPRSKGEIVVIWTDENHRVTEHGVMVRTNLEALSYVRGFISESRTSKKS